MRNREGCGDTFGDTTGTWENRDPPWSQPQGHTDRQGHLGDTGVTPILVPRYGFLLDKALIICKRRGDSYEAKVVVDLQSHQLRDSGLSSRDGKKVPRDLGVRLPMTPRVPVPGGPKHPGLVGPSVQVLVGPTEAWGTHASGSQQPQVALPDEPRSGGPRRPGPRWPQVSGSGGPKCPGPYQTHEAWWPQEWGPRWPQVSG